MSTIKRYSIIFAACALLVAGCGIAGGRTGDDTEGKNVNYAAAKDAVTKAKTRPTKLWVTEPLGAPIPKNKTLYYIVPNIPYTASSIAWITAATKAVGWKVVPVLAGQSREDIKNAWERAVNANPPPDAVYGGGFDRSIMEPEIQKLAAKKIPVILGYVADSPGRGVTAIVSQAKKRNPRTGALQADWVIADSQGKGDAPDTVFVMTPALSSQGPQFDGFNAEYRKLCPGCSLSKYEVPVSDIGTSFPQKLVAYLQGHPDVNHVVLAYGDYAVGLPTALRNAGMTDRVRIITDSPEPTVAKYIAKGDVIEASTASPGPEINWQIVDILLRHFARKDIRPSTQARLPQWIMTPKTIPSTTEPFPIVADYQRQFKQLWGVSG